MLALFLIIPLTLWANPFRDQPEPQGLNILQQSALQINQAQKGLKTLMVGYVHEYKSGGRPLSLLIILGLSFAYGIVHAIGPGHGKSVILAYLLTREGNLKKGILTGSLAAFMHGVSAIVVVLIIYKLSLGRMSSTFHDISKNLVLISYSLIILIGIYLLLSRIRAICKKEQDTEFSPKDGLAMIASIGLVPCPGAMIILLFFMSMQLMSLGVIMALSMSLGMGLTVAMIAILGSGTKQATTNPHLRHGLEIGGALFIIILGTSLLISQLV
ncbi:MAG: hypothetical protein U9P80_04435 [Thermodesulfobacteriota bacterium]|nr:hypothetical protein [Thermodesulfobacteriota bacterium]